MTLKPLRKANFLLLSKNGNLPGLEFLEGGLEYVVSCYFKRAAANGRLDCLLLQWRCFTIGSIDERSASCRSSIVLERRCWNSAVFAGDLFFLTKCGFFPCLGPKSPECAILQPPCHSSISYMGTVYHVTPVPASVCPTRQPVWSCPILHDIFPKHSQNQQRLRSLSRRFRFHHGLQNGLVRLRPGSFHDLHKYGKPSFWVIIFVNVSLCGPAVQARCFQNDRFFYLNYLQFYVIRPYCCWPKSSMIFFSCRHSLTRVTLPKFI